MIAYTDTSSLMRAFLADADQHEQARARFMERAVQGLSSDLLRVETRRTAHAYVNDARMPPALLTDTDNYVQRHVGLAPIRKDVLLGAFGITHTIKSADAIHLATAVRLADQLDAVVTSDRRMLTVGRELGLPMFTVPETLAALTDGPERIRRSTPR